MGMDVMGQNPTNEVGEYFRRNVWGWHPLWQYVEDTHPDLAKHVKEGHSNSGDGLKSRRSKELSLRLYKDIESGVAERYVTARNTHLATLPATPCRLCNATGIRTDEVGVENNMPTRELSKEVQETTGRTHGWCNGCSGIGTEPAWETNYHLDVDDIQEFANFLEHCGGFQIC